MIASRHFLFFLGLILLGFVPGADAAEWKQQRYTADGFQVEFSGQTSVNETEMSAETRKVVVRSSQYLQDGGSYAYIVMAALYTRAPNFESGMKSGNATGACKTLAEKTISMAGADQAREFDGSGCKIGRWLARYVLKGNWLYQILAIYPNDGDADAARRFVNSFKLL